jgi:hypothetical protein
MTTQGADSGGPSGRKDSLPGRRRRGPWPEVEARLVGVQDRPPSKRAIYGLALAGLICGAVATGLAIGHLIGYPGLQGYQAVFSGLSTFLGILLIGIMNANPLLDRRTRRIVKAGLLLCILGFIGLGTLPSHGNAWDTTMPRLRSSNLMLARLRTRTGRTQDLCSTSREHMTREIHPVGPTLVLPKDSAHFSSAGAVQHQSAATAPTTTVPTET